MQTQDFNQSYGQPQYYDQQYGQPQYNDQQYGQPQYYDQQYGQPQYYDQQYGQPQEVADMRVAKLVWAFLMFWPLAIPALIFFSKAKSEYAFNPDQAVYFAERFNHFSSLAIRIGIIMISIVVLYYIVIIAILAAN